MAYSYISLWLQIYSAHRRLQLACTPWLSTLRHMASVLRAATQTEIFKHEDAALSESGRNWVEAQISRSTICRASACRSNGVEGGLQWAAMQNLGPPAGYCNDHQCRSRRRKKKGIFRLHQGDEQGQHNSIMNFRNRVRRPLASGDRLHIVVTLFAWQQQPLPEHPAHYVPCGRSASNSRRNSTDSRGVSFAVRMRSTSSTRGRNAASCLPPAAVSDST